MKYNIQLNPNLNATVPPAPSFQAFEEGRLKAGIHRAFLSTAYISRDHLEDLTFTTEDGQGWTLYPTEALLYAVKHSIYPVKAVISFQVHRVSEGQEIRLEHKAVAKLFRRPNRFAKAILELENKE